MTEKQLSNSKKVKKAGLGFAGIASSKHVRVNFGLETLFASFSRRASLYQSTIFLGLTLTLCSKSHAR